MKIDFSGLLGKSGDVDKLCDPASPKKDFAMVCDACKMMCKSTTPQHIKPRFDGPIKILDF